MKLKFILNLLNNNFEFIFLVFLLNTEKRIETISNNEILIKTQNRAWLNQFWFNYGYYDIERRYKLKDTFFILIKTKSIKYLINNHLKFWLLNQLIKLRIHLNFMILMLFSSYKKILLYLRILFFYILKF